MGGARQPDQGRQGRCGDPLRAGGAAGPARDRRRVCARPAAALSCLRAARRERGVPRPARSDAGAAARRGGRARPGQHRRPRDAPPPARRSRRDHDLHVPDDRTGPRRRHRGRRAAARAGQRQPRGHRPLRGGAGGRAQPAAEDRAPWPLQGGRPAARGDQPRLPRLGRRRTDRARLPGRPHHAGPDEPAAGDGRARHDARVDRLRRDRHRRMLITNIGTLVTNDPELGTLTDASIVFEDGKVAWVGHTPPEQAGTDRLDAEGRAVIPGFVDSHGHLVFAGDRAQEFAARMEGRPYSAGGIKTTVAATRDATDDQLKTNLDRLTAEALRSGTTTTETKSGYGLTVHDERRCLQVADGHERTFLGAHVVPPEHDADTYVELIKGEMLDACAPHATWIDVFCEDGAFNGEHTRAILEAGIKKGLTPRVHANQLHHGPGVQIAVELDAASADHVTHVTDADIDALANSNTVATLLPGAEFSTRAQYPDARRLIDAGVTVALAADCNPGSSYTTNIPFCIAIAVREMRMTPDEAVWAATAGGAQALRRTDIGRLSPGARADAVLLEAPSHIHLAYRPGVPLVSAVWKDGRQRFSNV